MAGLEGVSIEKGREGVTAITQAKGMRGFSIEKASTLFTFIESARAFKGLSIDINTLARSNARKTIKKPCLTAGAQINVNKSKITSETGVNVVTGGVVSVTDQSVSGNDLLNIGGTGANYGSVVNNAYKTIPAIQLNTGGTFNNMYIPNNVVSSESFTIYAVYKKQNTTPGFVFKSSLTGTPNGNESRAGYYENEHIYGQQRDRVYIGSAGEFVTMDFGLPTDSKPTVLMLTFHKGVLRVVKNGVILYASPVSGTPSGDSFAVCWGLLGGVTNQLNCNLFYLDVHNSFHKELANSSIYQGLIAKYDWNANYHLNNLGDSLSTTAFTPNPWMTQLFADLNTYKWTNFNYANSGQQLVQIDAFKNAIAPRSAIALKTFNVIWEGTNDIYNNGDSGATAYNRLVAVYKSIKDKATKNFIFTMLPRQNDTAKEAQRIIYNNLIRNNAAANDYAVVDIASNSSIGSLGSQSNSNYVGDLIHLSDAGQAIVKNEFKTILTPFL